MSQKRFRLKRLLDLFQQGAQLFGRSLQGVVQMPYQLVRLTALHGLDQRQGRSGMFRSNASPVHIGG
jgi:hypothetical protein